MKGILQGVTDRNKDVREVSELVLAKLIPINGLEMVQNLTKDYKDAFKTQIKALLVKLGYEDARKVDKAKTMTISSSNLE
jgi:hypothetical protein